MPSPGWNVFRSTRPSSLCACLFYGDGMNLVRPWMCAHFHLDSSALGTRVAFTSSGVQQRKLRVTYAPTSPSFARSLAGSWWHPCPHCTGRLGFCSGHLYVQGANFLLSNQVFSKQISTSLLTLSQTKLNDNRGAFRWVFLIATPVLYPLIPAPYPAGRLFLLCLGRVVFALQESRSPPTTNSNNWSCVLSSLQISPISQHASAAERLYVDDGLNDFLQNAASNGHSRVGQARPTQHVLS
jgi:hypothetical protein